MAHFDVFNGDADGLCALHQLRLEMPRDAERVTGLKREIALLERVDAAQGDSVTVLDIAMTVNRAALLRLLERGADVEYFDHHASGDVPQHPRLRAFVDTSPNMCTSLLVDRHLAGRRRVWAVVAAYGDNLEGEAGRLGALLGLDPAELAQLRELGECLNYNAYGDSDADPVVHPAKLYPVLARHPDPFRFIAEEAAFGAIAHARDADIAAARRERPTIEVASGFVYVLPDATWSRRVRGDFANELARGCPGRAHAVLTPNAHGGYAVSVRAPRERNEGADALCRRFPTGEGRVAAAGINHLPAERLQEFIAEFDKTFADRDVRGGVAPPPASGAREPCAWEHFDHEADIGVRGLGGTKAEAFEQAAIALTAIVTDPANVALRDEVVVRCEAPDDELLFAEWLNRLVYEMATRRFVFGRYSVRIDGLSLTGHAWGEPVDVLRHRPAVEPKGATYTALRVACEAGHWIAQTVVDV